MKRALMHTVRNTSGTLLVAICVALCGVAAGSNDAQSGDSTQSEQIQAELAAKEQKLIDAERQHDSDTFKELLRDDLIYVAFNGWMLTKQDLVSKMSYIDVTKYDMANMRVRVPASDTALITYDLKAKASLAGHTVPRKQYVSSLWVKNSGKWQLLFHQATPATHP